MGKILVSGLINIETTLQIDGFPIHYTPVRYPFFGVNSTVSGVGYNVAKALTVLGSDVRFLSLIGRDQAGQNVMETLHLDGISRAYVAAELEQTPRSVILYEASGRRMINVDLKDIQEREYPAALFDAAAEQVTLAVVCNVNFSRPMLDQMKGRGVPIATDVHAIADLNDNYNQDFMRQADILFMSHELLPCAPDEWGRRLWNRFGMKIVVVGMGADGALLGVDGTLQRIPAVNTRPIVNTIGAGDALFACFVHRYNQIPDPVLALQQAVVFASYKIGATGAADGFLSQQALDELCVEVGR